jgi:hypothetical protein
VNIHRPLPEFTDKQINSEPDWTSRCGSKESPTIPKTQVGFMPENGQVGFFVFLEREFVSQPGLHGEARTAKLGSVSRVPALDIEQAIVTALRKHLNDEQIRFDRATLTTLLSSIQVQRNQLVISLRPTDDATEADVFSIPWQKPLSKRARKILLPHGASKDSLRPERAERRARLVSAIARGRSWLQEIVIGSVKDAEQLAKRERCTVRQINLTLSLAFLAPQLVKAAVEGRLPRGINIERLRDSSAEWNRQFQELGLDPH